jgi:hypothetical protein
MAPPHRDRNGLVWLAGLGEWGMFVGGNPTTPSRTWLNDRPENVQQDFSFVHVEGLETPLQFSRVRLAPIVGVDSTDHIVVSAFPPFPARAIPTAVRMILPAASPAAVCFVVQDQIGWASATSVARISPESVAAAVAHSKIVGAWDESDPIVITVDGDAFQVSGQFENGSWRLEVARAW